jgi:hypothetical protein
MLCCFFLAVVGFFYAGYIFDFIKAFNLCPFLFFSLIYNFYITIIKGINFFWLKFCFLPPFWRFFKKAFFNIQGFWLNSFFWLKSLSRVNSSSKCRSSGIFSSSFSMSKSSS